METIKSLFGKPDPQAQMRKCNVLIRSNMRKLDRDIAAAKVNETKAKNLIVTADKRGQKDANRAAQAAREVRGFARELVRTRRSTQRLITSRAQLASVQMQVNEAFALRKIEGSIRASVGVMKDINRLIRMPELAGTMRELSMELMKAGVIEDMVHEQLPEDGLIGDDDEAEEEVEKVLGEILKDRIETTGPIPSVPLPKEQEPEPVALDEDEEDTEAMMDQMRNRLEALRS